MSKKNKFTNIWIPVFAALLYFILLLFIKYYTNGLEIKISSLLQIGTFFNAVPLFISIAAAGYSTFTKKKIGKGTLTIVNLLLFLSIILLLVSLLLNYVNIDFILPFIYYPVRKVALGISFSAGYFLQLFASIYLLYAVFNQNYIAPIRAFYFSVIIPIAFIVISFVTVLNTSNHTNKLPRSKSEVGVVLGAAVWNKNTPSPLFKARIERGYELYRLGTISKIQVTGGNAPGELSEAEVARNYLIELGVNKSDILFEEKTTTTAEQIKFLKGISKKYGGKNLAVISDAFHLRRIIEMSKFFDVQVNGISSNYKLNWRKSIYYYLRESIALLLFWLFAI